MKTFLSLVVLGLFISGCQTQPKFSVTSKKDLTIENYKFEEHFAKDLNGSDWKLVEIRPKKLPYTGKIAQLTAQERWLKLFDASLESIKKDCKGPPVELPEFLAAELDYTKFGNSPGHPAYIQARYRCR